MTVEPIKILFVEDSAVDAELIARDIRKQGLVIVAERVESQDALVRALQEFQPDVVLSDYSIPGFSGMKALEICHRDYPDIPFIFVSGTIGEERAIEALRKGAVDYVLKDNQARLGPAIMRALREMRSMRAHRAADLAREEYEKRFRLFMDHIPAAVYIKDSSGRFAYVNSEFERLAGKTIDVSRTSAVGESELGRVKEIFSGSDEHVLQQGQKISIVEEVMIGNSPHFFLMQKFPIAGTSTLDPMIGGIALDVTGSYYDALTGLANSQLFFDRQAQLLDKARSESLRLAVVVMDVQKFRNINNTLGRSAADEVLRVCARHLKQTIPDEMSYTLARLSGDRFAVTVLEPGGGEFATRAQQWMPQLQLDPIVVDGIELHIAFKVGVAIFPGDGDNADVLFKNAEAALQRAKETTQMCVFYSSEMNARVAERLRFETRLHRAVEQNQFELYYQPKIDLKTREILGLEALIRWNDPDHGQISPLQFIPLLEQSGFIVDVGRWIFRQAMTDIRRWQAAGLVAPRVAVNVSQVQLRQPDFVELVFAAIDYKPGQPILCDLEITESLVMEDGEAGIEKLRRLREAGMRIFMDDFGTGYSSLSQVTALPLDALKIDRSFISNMTRDMALVSTIISLAHALKVDVVAEGVETEEQAAVLLGLNCGQAQGYLFSKPIPAHNIAALLKKAH